MSIVSIFVTTDLNVDGGSTVASSHVVFDMLGVLVLHHKWYFLTCDSWCMALVFLPYQLGDMFHPLPPLPQVEFAKSQIMLAIAYRVRVHTNKRCISNIDFLQWVYYVPFCYVRYVLVHRPMSLDGILWTPVLLLREAVCIYVLLVLYTYTYIHMQKKSCVVHNNAE